MSLKSFLALPDVTAAVKLLRPKLRRKIDVPMKAAPRSTRYTMVGTAFDYLLRFELQRRAPHAVAEEWVAELALGEIYGGRPVEGKDAFVDPLGEFISTPHYLPPEELARRARAIVDGARSAVASYLKSMRPTRAQLSGLAAHAIRLAKLDQVYREYRLEPGFEEADAEDVEDLLGMLEIVPFDSLVHRKTMLLNPTFGESSMLVGGADVDLIAGDLLVDFKVTKQGEMQASHLDQLLGYSLLARRHRRHDPSFPEIKRVALYFGRHGLLWPLDVAVWTDHPDFPRVEEWFFERAAGSPASRPSIGSDSSSRPGVPPGEASRSSRLCPVQGRGDGDGRISRPAESGRARSIRRLRRRPPR
jgi:hypothetical protein